MFVRELMVTYRVTERSLSAPVSTPREAAAFLAPILAHEPVEVFLAVFLNTRHRVIAFHEAARGTLDAALIHPREIFKAAFLANAAGLLLAHNHPSGDPEPSPLDDGLTSRLRQAGEIVGVEVVDHIIIGHDGRYCSYRESGRI